MNYSAVTAIIFTIQVRGYVMNRLWNNAWITLSLAAFMWASNFVIGRIIPPSMPPVSLSFWRWTLAACILLPFVWSSLKKEWRVVLRHWPIILLLGTTGQAGSNTLAYYGLHSTGATVALLIQSATPVVILLFAFFFMVKNQAQSVLWRCFLPLVAFSL